MAMTTRFAFYDYMSEELFTPMGTAHPCWMPEWFQLSEWMVYLCCFVLFWAGIICSAGGIGGGGVYVTVLMVAGGLPIADAVPLSKAIVFSGSMSTLFLNLRKSFGSGNTKTLIDYNICRLVVPGALVGTLFGVLLNNVLPGWVIGLLLVLILIFISSMTSRTLFQQWKEEKAQAKSPDEAPEASTPAPPPPAAAPEPAANTGEPAATQGKKSMRSKSTAMDMIVWFLCLFMVIFFGVLRFHTGRCQQAVLANEIEERCNHRIFGYLGHGTMQRWMQNESSALVVRIVAYVVPICTCFLAIGLYSVRLMAYEAYSFVETQKYVIMAIITGTLAGLLGIGGGLIFSPFFLVVGIEPAIAVATSSTCVIFTSSSTTLQYLLTDRIIISLVIIYGIVNLAAAYLGTKAVHYLQDNFGCRKSYISAIVLVGVLLSTVLAIIKFIQVLVMGPQHHPSSHVIGRMH
jgi:uncharacterized membrane protein YfcA